MPSLDDWDMNAIEKATDRLIETQYIGGLDLAQISDFSALAILERWREVPKNPGIQIINSAAYGRQITVNDFVPKLKKATPWRYRVRHLEQWQGNYVKQCDRLIELYGKAPISGSMLAVDQTGVGRPVVNMIEKGLAEGVPCKCQGRLRACLACGGKGRLRVKCIIRPITITGGTAPSVGEDGGWHVPKRDLISSLQVVLGNERLSVSSKLSLAKTAKSEFEAFRMKVNERAHEQFDTWRVGKHDDILLAIAMAVWLGEKGTQQLWVR